MISVGNPFEDSSEKDFIIIGKWHHPMFAPRSPLCKRNCVFQVHQQQRYCNNIRRPKPREFSTGAEYVWPLATKTGTRKCMDRNHTRMCIVSRFDCKYIYIYIVERYMFERYIYIYIPMYTFQSIHIYIYIYSVRVTEISFEQLYIYIYIYTHFNYQNICMCICNQFVLCKFVSIDLCMYFHVPLSVYSFIDMYYIPVLLKHLKINKYIYICIHIF